MIYICMCVNKQDLALNNTKGLICHTTQPNQTKPNFLNSHSSKYGTGSFLLNFGDMVGACTLSGT